jgi:hypothetical protein
MKGKYLVLFAFPPLELACAEIMSMLDFLGFMQDLAD